MGSDPTGAAELLDEARTRTGDTLSELRRLSKGIMPPLLQDRGLGAALEALAERNPVPTAVSIAPAAVAVLSPEAQQGIYYVVSELYANAVRHSGATRLETHLDRDAHSVLLTVTDDGVGGATARPGGGLEGLAERVKGLGGQLRVLSPAGGPTVATLTLALEA